MALTRRRFLLASTGTLGALIIGWGVLPPRNRLGAGYLFSDGTPDAHASLLVRGTVSTTSFQGDLIESQSISCS